MVNGMISVIIPAYNADKYIAQCIESVCQQTYPNIEIIVINDGSSDMTESIVRSLAQKDPRIIYISQKNNGSSVARNNGLNSANGEFIMFLDADDWIERNCCEVTLNIMQADAYDIVIFDYNKIINGESFKHNAYYGSILTYEKGLENNFFLYDMRSITVWGKLYRKEIINGIVFDPEMKTAEDVDFNFKIYNIVNKAIYINEHLLNYRVLDDSAIHGYDENIQIKLNYALDRMYKYMNKNHEQKKAYYSFAGITYILLCQNGICLNKKLSYFEKYRQVKMINQNVYVCKLFKHTNDLVMPLSRKLIIYCGKWHLNCMIILMINVKKRFKNL